MESKLKLPNIQNIIDNINKLGELFNKLDENREQYGDKKAEVMFYTEKERIIKQYLNYIKTTLLFIKNSKMYDRDASNQIYIPKSWNLDESYKESLEKLMVSTTKHIKKLDTDSSDIGYVKTLLETVEGHITNANKLLGKEHIETIKYVDGKSEDELKFSDMTHRNSSYILHYIFILTIKSLLNDDILDESDPSSNLKETTLLSEEYVELESDDIDLEVAIESHNVMKYKIIEEVIKLIVDRQMFENKHTNKYINSIIEKRQDIQKEENLKFIEELSKESRNGFKLMLSMGLDTWKNMSGKNKSLYFDEQISEDVEYSPEELDQINRNKAGQELGENVSDEQYQEWLTNNTQQQQEDNLAFEERDIMEDDDE